MEELSRNSAKLNKKTGDAGALSFFMGVLVLFCCAALVTAFLWLSEWEPSGGDIWGHLYKSKFMYDSLSEGTFYPLYSERWYNGIQLYRYWPPLVYYVMSFLQLLTGGNVIHAYYLFAGFVVFVGGLPFVLLGRSLNKPVVAVVCALLWFFLPDNIRVFFCEGNMPRIMTSVLIPYVVYFLWGYMRRKKLPYLVGLMVSMALMTVTHLMITALVGIGTFLFLVFDWIRNRELRRDIEALSAMIIGILISGIWFIPAMSGGMLSMGDSSSQTQDLLTYPLTTSLNFMNRVNGDAGMYYFGISVLLVSVFGILLANGKRKAGFLLAIVVLLGTTPATVSVTKHLPLGEFLWMTRFTALAYAYFMLSLMEWRTLKRKYSVIVMAVLVIDSIITVFSLPRYHTPSSAEAVTDTALLKEYTTGRANVMDLSSYGPYPSWELVTGEGAVNYTFGWAWQGAVTAQNIMLMNEALEAEQYYYVFDRSIELGSDTVLVKRSYVFHEDDMLEAAEACGYNLIDTTESGYFFKKNTPDVFGVKTEYLGFAIGRYAGTISEFYPAFSIGKSNFIDDYTLEELTRYKTLFLSGFEYHDKEAAEKLLRDAAHLGTRVVIDSSHIPEDGVKQKKFLDVTQNMITFKGNFPNLNYEGRSIIAGSIPAEEEEWRTGYVDSAEHVLGYIEDGGQKIPFLSYNSSDKNIYYLGLNLAFFAINTDNMDIWGILNDCFGINYNQVPNRELVPITIERNGNTMIIESEQENVNTTLAFQDNFETKQDIRDENNMLVIGDKRVEIEIVYPHLLLGSVVSVFGVLAGVVMTVVLRQSSSRH